MTAPSPSRPASRAAAGRRAAARLRFRLLALPRVAFRLAAIVAVTLVFWLAIVVRRPFLPRGRRDRWGNRVFRTWSGWLGWLAGWRLEVRGTPPRAPFLLVSNHLGYVDVLLLGRAAGGTFVAKREIAGWPAIGALCRSVGTVFIDRGAKRDLLRVARLVEDALAADKGVVIFPEGTTSDGGEGGRELLPFRSSLLQVAATEGHPVHYATLRYATGLGLPPARRAVCWTGGAPLVPHVLRLLALPHFDARITFGSEPITDPDRKQLAHRLRQAMEAQLREE